MSTIHVSIPSVTRSTLRTEIDYEGDVGRFLTGENLVVEYDVDVDDVSKGLLTIPALAQVCPVAWTANAEVHVPVVDETFLRSLQAVGSVLHEMYPAFVKGGRVTAGETVDTAPTVDHTTTLERGHVDGSSADAGMLFTGGVDSLATYLHHREKDLVLITVQGWTVDIEDNTEWSGLKRRIEAFGDRFDAETQFVQSNMLSVLDTAMLTAQFKPYHDGGWYSAVGCGLGLSGLCAPFAASRGLETLYVAASTWEDAPNPSMLDHWTGRGMPWGSHPALDDQVAWDSTEVIHDGFELTRQERIKTIAEYVRATGKEVPIHSCSRSESVENCNRCEKCARTALGLLVAGLNPNRHGFNIDETTFEYTRHQFEVGGWTLDENVGVHWKDIVDNADPDRDLPIEGAAEFLRWLRAADIDEIVARSNPPRRDRALQFAVRHAPTPVYARLRPMYASLQRMVGQW